MRLALLLLWHMNGKLDLDNNKEVSHYLSVEMVGSLQMTRWH
jgi:hypothetical protein